MKELNSNQIKEVAQYFCAEHLAYIDGLVFSKEKDLSSQDKKRILEDF